MATEDQRDLIRDLNAAKTKLEVLNKELETINNNYQKIERAIIRLEGITAKLDNLLAVQEHSIASVEKVLDARENQIRSISDTSTDNIRRELSEVRRELSAQIVENTKTLGAEIEKLQDALNNSVVVTEGKISSLNRSRWILYGGGALFFLLLQILAEFVKYNHN